MPCLASFSNDGHYYALVGNDGKLKIWNVISGRSFQEYIPDVHLTAPLTEIHWVTYNMVCINRKRKFAEDDVEDSEHLLLGTRKGDILIYSLSAGRVIDTLKGGHNAKINSISWNKSVGNRLFSSSNDHYVAEWDLQKNSVFRKWKCGKTSCIVVSPDGKSLLTAYKDIKWWDISAKETVVKSFIGHAYNITKLIYSSISGTDCIFSCCKEDRQIQLWTLKNNNDRQAAATFNANDFVTSLSVISLTSSGGVSVATTTKMGILHLYDCVLNGKNKKPLKPKLTVQIAAESEVNSKGPADTIPIIDGLLCDDTSCYIAYGEDILSFEKLPLENTSSTMYIIRQDPRKKMFASKELIATKVLPANKSKHVHYVHPEAINGLVTQSTKVKKRSLNMESNKEVPLELRLRNLAVDAKNTVSIVGSSESLVHLLLQGLRSKDMKILHDVLIQNDEAVIKSTVLKLPVEAIVPFSTELVNMLHGRPTESDAAVKWLKCIILLHAAHLISNPEISEVFSPMFPIIEGRLNMMASLYRLSGRLDLVIGQLEDRTNNTVKMFENISSQPRLTYQDKDSEDEGEEGNNVEDNKRDREEDNNTDEDVIISEEINDVTFNEADDRPWDEMSEIDTTTDEDDQQMEDENQNQEREMNGNAQNGDGNT